MNGDGISDVLVGSPWEAVPGWTGTIPQPYNTLAGATRLYSGAGGSLLRVTRAAVIAEHELGQLVDRSGDTDGDGVGDYLVATCSGIANGTKTGRVILYSGASGSPRIVLDGTVAWQRFGAAVDAIGDVDLDGVPDFAVGTPSSTWQSFNEAGNVTVFSGASGVSIYDVGGAGSFAHFGSALAGVGDVDLDGRPDFAVGAPGDSAGASWDGSARLVSGGDGKTLWTVAGGEPYGLFGASIGSAGDFDRDGRVDIVVGATGSETFATPHPGSARVLSGVTGAVLYQHVGAAIGNATWGEVLGVGDVNGDGSPDVAMTGPLADTPAGPDAGVMRVFTRDSVPTCGAIAVVGVGCPGSAASIPKLDVAGCPAFGKNMTLQLTQALGGAPAFLLVGQPSLAPSPCLLMSAIQGVLPMFTSAGGPGAGAIGFTVGLPTGAGPVTARVQALVMDAGAVGAYAASNAVDFTIL